MTAPIRVLQVVTHMNRGGLETMLMNYYRNIDKSLVKFDFLVHRSARADYDDEIESLGGKIYRISRLVPWSNSYKKELECFFKSHPEYSIVHVHQDCLSSVILKAAKRCGVKTRIAHSHNSNQDKDLKYPIKLFYKRFIPKYATDLFSCGKDAGDFMFGGADYKILNNAIDAKSYTFNGALREKMRKELKIEERFVVGLVARFSPQKNHSFLLDIFAEILRLEPNSALLLVGDGELRDEITEKIKALGIEKSVIMTGVKPNISDYLQCMDVFIFPSIYEGLALVSVEAQAAGLPCFISDGVPIGCKLTDLVFQIPLAASPKTWAVEVLKVKNTPRYDTYQSIVDSGFDIKENSKMLENFYRSSV